MRRGCLGIVLLLLIVFGVGGILAANATRPIGSNSGITMAQFDAVQTGMPCDALPAQLGGAGKVLSQSDVGGHRTVIYGWDGVGSIGANANITCQDGVVVGKAQAGLR